MWAKARRRAAEKGRPFTITPEDIVIPQTCPLTGVTLVFGSGNGPGAKQNSPSLDCIIPELGYVKANIWVISQQANILKNGITPDMMRLILEEIEARGLEQ